MGGHVDSRGESVGEAGSAGEGVAVGIRVGGPTVENGAGVTMGRGVRVGAGMMVSRVLVIVGEGGFGSSIGTFARGRRGIRAGSRQKIVRIAPPMDAATGQINLPLKDRRPNLAMAHRAILILRGMVMASQVVGTDLKWGAAK